MRILMIGDIIGKPGRRAIRNLVPALREEHSIDLVIANGENTAGGFGITRETAYELLESGVDILTSGNHIWDQKEIIPHLDEGLPLLRPANYPDAPGHGYMIQGDVMIVNLMGRVFKPTLDCPFRTASRLLKETGRETEPGIIIVDFHAEATSEKYVFQRRCVSGKGVSDSRSSHSENAYEAITKSLLIWFSLIFIAQENNAEQRLEQRCASHYHHNSCRNIMS